MYKFLVCDYFNGTIINIYQIGDFVLFWEIFVVPTFVVKNQYIRHS